MIDTQIDAGRRLWLALAGALAMACFMGFGRFSYTPILPVMMAGLKLSASDAGLIAAANFAGYLAGALLAAGRWAAGRERPVAFAALVATALLLAAMAGVASLPAFMLIRFLAGVASAFGLVFTAAMVLGAAPGDTRVQATHFGGVGLGIALSALVSFAIGRIAGPGANPWQLEWLAGAGLVGLAGFLVIAFLPRMKAGPGPGAREPSLDWTGPMLRVTLSYLLFGFGYVVAATFLVAMARASASGPAIECLSWVVTGLAGMASLFAWSPVHARFGLNTAYRLALAVEAAGSVAMVLLPSPLAPLVGGLLFGGTFIVVTAYALNIGRALSPRSPRRVIGLMTAGFGIGQIAGPVIAGFIVDRTGSYLAASLIAAAALALASLLAPAKAFPGKV